MGLGQLGLHAALNTYNMYALPVLLFVAQLESSPPEILRLEEVAVRRVAPGPGLWCSHADLRCPRRQRRRVAALALQIASRMEHYHVRHDTLKATCPDCGDAEAGRRLIRL